jgi:hypothetical protein
MSLDPAIFRALVANGASPEMLLAVVEASAAVDQERLERKRAGNAERQHRFREARKAESNENNALQAVTERDSVTVSPSLDKSPPDPQKLIPTPPTHTHEARARGTAWPCPEGVDPNHWRDFLAGRKRKRMVTTQTALDGVLSDLAELSNDEWPPGRLVKLAAAKGWGSINLPDGYQNGRPTTNGMAGSRKPAGRTGDGFINAIREARAIREAVPWDASDAGAVPRLASMGQRTTG